MCWYYHAENHRETRQEACGSTRTLGTPQEGAEVRRDPALDRSSGPIETAEDLIEWVDAAEGNGLGLAQKKS